MFGPVERATYSPLTPVRMQFYLKIVNVPSTEYTCHRFNAPYYVHANNRTELAAKLLFTKWCFELSMYCMCDSPSLQEYCSRAGVSLWFGF